MNHVEFGLLSNVY